MEKEAVVPYLDLTPPPWNGPSWNGNGKSWYDMDAAERIPWGKWRIQVTMCFRFFGDW